MPFSKSAGHPEAMVSLLFTIMDKTPHGGATMDDLKEAYAEVKGTFPANRTIQRLIRRINLLFDPLGDSEQKLLASKQAPAGTRYVATRNFTAPNRLNARQALVMALSLLPAQRTMNPADFDVVVKMIFEQTVRKLVDNWQLWGQIDQYVYVSGFTPVESAFHMQRVFLALDAVSRRKQVKFDYRHAGDGTVVKGRLLEPYGALCRNGTWYLVGRAVDSGERRIFRFDHIEALTIVENSIFSIPDGFTLKESYSSAWGTWTEAEAEITVIKIKVSAPIYHKFTTTKYHESQCQQLLADGSGEITFQVTGAQEMVSWLLSWGDQIEVLEPKWLREKVAEKAASICSLYGR